MRDCPACKVPLHGYEEVCPSCGTKQYPQKSSRGPYGTNFKPEEPKVNWIPFVLVFVVAGICLIAAMQGTWIGQVMRGENKQPDDPIAQMTTMDARTVIETELNKNLEAAGATAHKLEWKAGGGGETAEGAAPVDARSLDGAVELDVTAKLPGGKEMIPQMVDPIKPYMEKAKIHSLVFNESSSRASRTYNVQIPLSTPDPEAAE
jgi:hypothetical protein